MLTYTVKKEQDNEFFSSPHYDAVSTVQIKDGDMICICNHCGKLHLQSSWDANDGKCANCDSSERKNITKSFLKTYNKSLIVSASGRNRIGNSVQNHAAIRRKYTVVSVSNANKSVTQTVRRRPQPSAPNPYDLKNDLLAEFEALHNYESTHVYPQEHERRHVAGSILLGLVIALIIAAVIAGIVLL